MFLFLLFQAWESMSLSCFSLRGLILKGLEISLKLLRDPGEQNRPKTNKENKILGIPRIHYLCWLWIVYFVAKLVKVCLDIFIRKSEELLHLI